MPRINADYRKDAKKKIIDAAVEVAVDDGWGGLTLESIAQKVGVTKGAFYSYFPNSMTLMQDVIIAMITMMRDHAIVTLLDKDDIHAALDHLGNDIFLHPKSFLPVFIQAMANIPKDPVFVEKISVLYEENIAFFVSKIARYQKNGQIPEDTNLDDAARAIYCMTIGLALTTHMMRKDGATSKRVWVESAERILGIDSVRQ
ncbi:TetR/AcrR family transcriptional regulator [Methanoregula sp.]|uniref:TetR/AcrR family transcriptional regulator n=1 Tax=Methanoregula sp. TaxID=2052170 RepID=UPI002369A305|nr:TetR/AcrR family transcriptional regulator [Methanoregula sp.]MDD1686024.1 TetR/AcrR family transcriptional regulator [Methanoregula sp.]